MQPLVSPLMPFTEGGSRSSADGGPETGSDEVKASERSVEIEEEETEEVRRPRVAKRPQMPTKAEIEVRSLTHCS